MVHICLWGPHQCFEWFHLSCQRCTTGKFPTKIQISGFSQKSDLAHWAHSPSRTIAWNQVGAEAEHDCPRKPGAECSKAAPRAPLRAGQGWPGQGKALHPGADRARREGGAGTWPLGPAWAWSPAAEHQAEWPLGTEDRGNELKAGGPWGSWVEKGPHGATYPGLPGPDSQDAGIWTGGRGLREGHLNTHHIVSFIKDHNGPLQVDAVCPATLEQGEKRGAGASGAAQRVGATT